MKKLIRRIFLLLSIFLVLFILYTFISTGLFRVVESVPGTEVYKKIELKGAEDLVISYIDSFAIISATDRSTFPALEQESGALYLMDLKDNDFVIRSISSQLDFPFAPHGISMIKTDSTYQIMAVNHTAQGEKIEVFSLSGNDLNHVETLSNSSMISPNDLVLTDKDIFYFTNDHGNSSGISKIMEEYLGLAGGNVVFYRQGVYSEVANKIAYANGINFDSKNNLVFVSSPRTFKINVYDRLDNNELKLISKIPCKSGIDNLEFDQKGALWTAGHPNLLKFKSYSQNKVKRSPSEVIKIEYESKDNFSVEQVFLDKGDIISASSVAAPFGDYILVGNVKDDEFLILKNVD